MLVLSSARKWYAFGEQDSLACNGRNRVSLPLVAASLSAYREPMGVRSRGDRAAQAPVRLVLILIIIVFECTFLVINHSLKHEILSSYGVLHILRYKMADIPPNSFLPSSPSVSRSRPRTQALNASVILRSDT